VRAAGGSSGPATALDGGQARTGYHPDAGAVRAARRFVEQRLHDLGLAEIAEDAGLLTSELAANAVLHARSSFDVVVHEVPCGARVEVHDRSPAVPVMAAARASATSGRGLVLVESVAVRWGCELDPGRGKRVWCELSTEERLDAGPSEEDLLAMWGDLDDDVPLPRVEPGPALHDVEIAAVPVQDLLAAKEHMDDLIREMQLVLLDPQPAASAAALAERGVAERLDAAARAFADARAQVRTQLARAAAEDRPSVTLRLSLPLGAAQDAARYRDALEEAEGLSARGELLAFTGLSRHAAVRRAYLDEVVAALADRTR